MSEADALPIDPDRPTRRPVEPDVLAVVALGGMIGATARFELARALPTESGGVQWATFWTNLSGSFVLGLLLAYAGIVAGRLTSRRRERA
jgi:fluoride exporter